MPKKPKPSEVFRETFVIQVPRRGQTVLREIGRYFYLQSLDFPDDDRRPAPPWNRELLRAVLLDLEFLDRHLQESYHPCDVAHGWRERRLAEAVEEFLPELRKLEDALRRALGAEAASKSKD